MGAEEVARRTYDLVFKMLHKAGYLGPVNFATRLAGGRCNWVASMERVLNLTYPTSSELDVSPPLLAFVGFDRNHEQVPCPPLPEDAGCSASRGFKNVSGADAACGSDRIFLDFEEHRIHPERCSWKWTA